MSKILDKIVYNRNILIFWMRIIYYTKISLVFDRNIRQCMLLQNLLDILEAVESREVTFNVYLDLS